MAQTHQQVTKVWIAPGCIVCDACETDCPEVFDVQEETCLIRPDAQSADFTKPLTPSIITAAESCPVDVIKFETVEVEGPEPWAGQEQQADAAAGGGGPVPPGAVPGVGAGKPAAVVPQGPPSPKWAGLLAHSKISSRGRNTDPELLSRAKVPVEAVASALPPYAPPDAQAAAMVGSGLVRPRPGVAQRILQKAGVLVTAVDATRRQFNVLLAIAWFSIAAVGATCLAALQSFMVPKVSRQPPSIFRAGKLSDFPEPGVYEMFKASQGVWMVYLHHGKLVAISDICTHLGCIPNWLANDKKFKCPCHGSGFQMNGINFEGPAPRPLERFKIYIEGEFVMVDKSKKFRQELGQWGQEGSEIEV